jgi:type IV pilus assembly protein PilA
MLEKLRKDRGEEGFTLIELLVVIIIIGILAAIAIPVFLNQRAKGWDAAVKADLRNAATAQETYLTDTGVYSAETPIDVDPVDGELGSMGFKYSTGSNYDGGTAEITVTADTNQSYCLTALSASGTDWEYSSPGGLQEGDCS